MFDNFMTVEDTVSSDSDTVWVTKEDLIGETVVLGMVDYDPEYPGKYGPTARAVVDMFVVTGPHAGTLQPGTHLYTNMASQASAIKVGSTAVAVVESGTTPKGNKWYGLSYAVSAKDAKAALAKAKKAAGAEPAQATGTDTAAPF